MKRLGLLITLIVMICCSACSKGESDSVDELTEDFSNAFHEEISYEIISVEQGEKNIAQIEITIPDLDGIYKEIKSNDAEIGNEKLIKNMTKQLSKKTVKKEVSAEVIEIDGDWELASEKIINEVIFETIDKFIVSVFNTVEWNALEIEILEEVID